MCPSEETVPRNRQKCAQPVIPINTLMQSSKESLDCKRKTEKLFHTGSNWRPVSSYISQWRFPRWKSTNIFTLVFILVTVFFRVTEGCSSKSTPRPRGSSPTHRPNVTFQTYTCPPTYADWYCLNGAKCFFVKVQDAILYNCECAEGYMGPRCEFKDLDGSYMPARERVILETASIAGAACIAIVLAFLALALFYFFTERHKYQKGCHCDNEYGSVELQNPQYVYTISNPRHSSVTIEKEVSLIIDDERKNPKHSVVLCSSNGINTIQLPAEDDRLRFK